MALATWALIGLVLVLVVVLLVVKVTRGDTSVPGPLVTPAPEGVVHQATTVPESVSDAVGAPGPPVLEAPGALSGQAPLTLGGKAAVVYVGSEFCPYCAAERWALVVALGHFGTFENLGATSSSPTEVFSGVKTFTFDGSSFHSQDVAFSSVEEYGSSPSVTAPAGYQFLHKPDSFQREVMRRYDVSGFAQEPGSLPFVDVANRLVITGSGVGFSPGLLLGLSMGQIAADLQSPGNPVAEAIVGAANEITSAICVATADHPKAVCSSEGTLAGAARIGLR